jgi:hypothetical protein
MTIQELLKEARDILRDEGLLEALVFLEEEGSVFTVEVQDRLDGIRVRLKQLRRENRQGHLTSDQVEARQNKILSDLQAELRDLETSATTPASSQATPGIPSDLAEEIRQHISFAQMEMAFAKLSGCIPQLEGAPKQEVQLLINRWESFRRDKRSGMLDYQTISRTNTEITTQLLQLLE